MLYSMLHRVFYAAMLITGACTVAVLYIVYLRFCGTILYLPCIRNLVYGGIVATIAKIYRSNLYQRHLSSIRNIFIPCTLEN